MRNPFLIGSKIYLRPLDLEDAPVLTTWLNDCEVRRHLRIHRPLMQSAEESFLRKLGESDRDIVLGIVAREADHLIGATGFHQIDNRNRHAQFGITVGEKTCWGKGYGTETTQLMLQYAFETLNLNRVWLHVSEFNERARRVYQKVGFRTEGLLRQETYCGGRYVNTVVMTVIRDEWIGVSHDEGIAEKVSDS